MIAGKISLALNAISITRTAEKQDPEISKKIQLTKALRGSVRAIGLEHVMQCYVIWKFAENIEGAKKYLIDYTTDFRQAFVAGEFYDCPCFRRRCRIGKLIANDPGHPLAVQGPRRRAGLATNGLSGTPPRPSTRLQHVLLNVFASRRGQAAGAAPTVEAACKRILAVKEKGLIKSPAGRDRGGAPDPSLPHVLSLSPFDARTARSRVRRGRRRPTGRDGSAP
jgi:hypothetical protein